MATVTAEADLSTLRDPQRLFALLFGLVLVVVGILGFVPQVVSEGGLLLGLFGINALHNVVHILTGLLGLVLGYYAGGASLFNKVGGVLYLLVFVVGTVALALGSELYLNLNWADNLLHLALALVVGAVGFSIGEGHPT
jgi:hypothetical protein